MVTTLTNEGLPLPSASGDSSRPKLYFVQGGATKHRFQSQEDYEPHARVPVTQGYDSLVE